MSMNNRFVTIVMAKINKLIGKAEDPGEELDYSYEKQKDLLEDVKKGITEVTTAKSRLIAQREKLKKDVTKLDGQANECMRQGNEELAKEALERKVSTTNQITSLDEQIKKLTNDQNNLTLAAKRLESKIEQLGTAKETVKAQYTAAKASVKVNESLAGISNEIGNVGDAMEKARDKTDEMTARTDAINELTNAGVLNDSITGERQDTIAMELNKAKVSRETNEEFRKMKRKAMLKNNDLDYFIT